MANIKQPNEYFKIKHIIDGEIYAVYMQKHIYMSNGWKPLLSLPPNGIIVKELLF